MSEAELSFLTRRTSTRVAFIMVGRTVARTRYSGNLLEPCDEVWKRNNILCVCRALAENDGTLHRLFPTHDDEIRRIHDFRKAHLLRQGFNADGLGERHARSSQFVGDFHTFPLRLVADMNEDKSGPRALFETRYNGALHALDTDNRSYRRNVFLEKETSKVSIAGSPCFDSVCAYPKTRFCPRIAVGKEVRRKLVGCLGRL